MSLRNFISSMMKGGEKSSDEGKSSQHSSSRSNIRKRKVGPLTKLGEEDAVSEASSKLEESSSDNGSGSSCQDLSEDDQDKVFSQVLSLLKPEMDEDNYMHKMCKKMNVDHNNLDIGEVDVKSQPKKRGRMLQSAVVKKIERKIIYKEELLMQRRPPPNQIVHGQPVNTIGQGLIPSYVDEKAQNENANQKSQENEQDQQFFVVPTKS